MFYLRQDFKNIRLDKGHKVHLFKGRKEGREGTSLEGAVY